MNTEDIVRHIQKKLELPIQNLKPELQEAFDAALRLITCNLFSRGKNNYDSYMREFTHFPMALVIFNWDATFDFSNLTESRWTPPMRLFNMPKRLDISNCLRTITHNWEGDVARLSKLSYTGDYFNE